MRSLSLLAGVAIVAAACGGTSPASRPAPTAAPTASPSPEPTAVSTAPQGRVPSATEIRDFAAFFDAHPLAGGQKAPFVAKWVSPSSFRFLVLNETDPAKATAVRYAGVGVKGVFCAEAQPDRSGSSFRHFQQLSAPSYDAGRGGTPGAQGYWLSYLATARFTAEGGRKVAPGVDYAFPATAPPSCGASPAAATFDAPGARALTKDELVKMASFYPDQLLQGGQVAPRLAKWLNEDVALFIQMDRPDPQQATLLNYVGIYERGTFSKARQPHTDFTHYHRVVAPQYSQGHAGECGEPRGYWLLWVAVRDLESGGRKIAPGVDRLFSPTPPPEC
jgi:hypothetical protein